MGCIDVVLTPNHSVHCCQYGFVGSAVTFLCARVWASNLALCCCVYQGVVWLPLSINHCQIPMVRSKAFIWSLDNRVVVCLCVWVSVCVFAYPDIHVCEACCPSFTNQCHAGFMKIQWVWDELFSSDEYCTKRSTGWQNTPSILKKEGGSDWGRGGGETRVREWGWSLVRDGINCRFSVAACACVTVCVRPTQGSNK